MVTACHLRAPPASQRLSQLCVGCGILWEHVWAKWVTSLREKKKVTITGPYFKGNFLATISTSAQSQNAHLLLLVLAQSVMRQKYFPVYQLPLHFREGVEKLLPWPNAHLIQHSPEDNQVWCYSSDLNYRVTSGSLLGQPAAHNSFKDKYLHQWLINSLSQNCVMHLTHFTLSFFFSLICVYRLFDLLITDKFCYILKQVFLSQ